MGSMETVTMNLFTNHVTFLLSLILPKSSWTKKIAFENKYYGVMKQKLSFLGIMTYRRFGARKVPNLQHGGGLMF